MNTVPGIVPMSTAKKALLAIEAVICFAPVGLLLLVGVAAVPIQVFAMLNSPLDWVASSTVVIMVVCGAVGLITLIYVLDKLFRGYRSISRPTLVCIGVALGTLPLVLNLLQARFATFSNDMAYNVSMLGMFALLPLAATAHIVILARRLLFSPWREGLKRAAIATAVSLSMLAVPYSDPSRASRHTIIEQQAIWHERAPQSYEFTIQTTGDAPPEAGVPKRIQVKLGKVISVKHAWNLVNPYNPDEDRKAGDPAPADGLWTIDRAFLELLAVEERGGDVNATYDERWGFVKKARANVGSEESWGVEIRDFSVVPSAAD